MTDSLLPVFSRHERTFHENQFVYPVISRRSRGVSVGINLNPDKICNFDCIYCQVNRRSEAEIRFVATEQLLQELAATLELVTSGKLFADPAFQSTPEAMRRLNDIAFSGDGEPTSFRNFDLIVNEVVQVMRSHALADTKLVLITNASLLHRPHVQRGLRQFDENRGEIWAKLDAGTAEYYHRIERTTIPFSQILHNISETSLQRPIVIQSLFLKYHGDGPSHHEIAEFSERLKEILATGGRIDRVQIYTVARAPAESEVTALTVAEVDSIVARVQQATGLVVEGYYGNVR